MSEAGTPRRKKPSKRTDPKAFRRFLQEFSWLMSTYDDLDFRALGEVSEVIGSVHSPSFLSSRTDRPAAAAMLVGSLPDLFTDETLFPTNEDIADFARFALGVVIPRWSKKSKYEIIGHVVCHTSVAGEERLAQVVEAMRKITDNREHARALISRNKERGLTWNELIQQLNSEV